jgi:hypothetical protein
VGTLAWHRRDQPIEAGQIRPDARATNQEVAGSSPAGRASLTLVHQHFSVGRLDAVAIGQGLQVGAFASGLQAERDWRGLAARRRVRSSAFIERWRPCSVAFRYVLCGS